MEGEAEDPTEHLRLLFQLEDCAPSVLHHVGHTAAGKLGNSMTEGDLVIVKKIETLPLNLWMGQRWDEWNILWIAPRLWPGRRPSKCVLGGKALVYPLQASLRRFDLGLTAARWDNVRRQHTADASVSISNPWVTMTLSPATNTQPVRILKQADMRAGLNSASVIIIPSSSRAERWTLLLDDVQSIHKTHFRLWI